MKTLLSPCNAGHLTRKFPSMPVRFWNDPDFQLYQATYFDKIPGTLNFLLQILFSRQIISIFDKLEYISTNPLHMTFEFSHALYSNVLT